jgi:hypothetical protein
MLDLERLRIDHATVVVLGLLERHDAVADILEHRLHRALEWVTPTAASARDEPCDLAPFQKVTSRLSDDDLAAVLM